jgi:hypothetical protein
MSLQVGLPFTDLVLRLSPRWGDSPRLLDVLPWAALSIVPFALILWLARYEMKLVPKFTAIRLVALRLSVLLLILFLIILQPAVTWPIHEKPPEVVVIAVDRSGSLDVTDPHRPPADKLRLAMVLHLARDLVPDLQLQEWIDQGGTPGEIKWVGDDEYPADRERRSQLAAERRKRYEDICKRVDALKRSEFSRAILAENGAGLIKALSEKFQVEIVGFDRKARTYQPDQLQELFAKPEDPHQAEFTDISLPLAQSLDREIKGPRVRGVILLTDGQHNPPPEASGNSTPGAIAAELGKQHIPVYPIGMGLEPKSPQKHSPAPPDVAVEIDDAPDTVLKDAQAGKSENVKVKAHVLVSELMPQELRVDLLLDGKPIDHRIVNHTDRERYPVEFAASLTQEGTHKLTVRVKEVPGEGYTGNNEASHLVKVVEDFSDVLLIDGEARWDHHYLATALARDSMVKKLDRVVFEQPRLNPRLDDISLQKVGYAMRALPEGDDALAAYDCIVLGDVSPEQMPIKDRKRLESYVSKRGGTLVIVAGKRFMPLGYASLPRDSDRADPLVNILPIREPRALDLIDGFPMTLTDEGRKSPLLQLDGNPFLRTEDELEKPRPAEELQRHYWAAVGEAKPGATVLAYAAEPVTTDRAQRKKQQDGQGLIVRQNYGKGKVLYVGVDSTWRWRYKTGDRFHHRFWGQIVRWAVGDRLLEGGNAQVRFGAEHTQYDPGQPMQVMLRLGDDAAHLKLADPRMRILRKTDHGEELAAVVPLSRREGQPQLLEGRFPGLPEGSYRLEPEAAELKPWLGEKADARGEHPRPAVFEVLTPQSKEMLALAPAWDQLELLADKSESGGRVYTAENALEIVKALKSQEEKEETRPEIRVWEWWPVLVLVLFLLTLEWVGRKLAGLP